MLIVKDVHKTFFPGSVNEKKALQGVDLTLKDGDFVTVIGSNGAGKSTLLNAVAGVFPIDTGRIEISGTDVTKMPEYQRARFIGRVFQDPMKGTAAGMMIEENLAIADRRGTRPGLRWSSQGEQTERFKAMLRELDLGLEDRMTAHVGLLSGGQRQAVTLLMATLVRPELLLLDEHTAALAPIMMHAGRVVEDIPGDVKKTLAVPDLLDLFEKRAGKDVAVGDAMLLG